MIMWFLIHFSRHTVQECAIAGSHSHLVFFFFPSSYPHSLSPLLASGCSHHQAMGLGHFCGSVLSAKLFAAVAGQRCIGPNWSSCWLDGHLSIRPEWNFSRGAGVSQTLKILAANWFAEKILWTASPRKVLVSIGTPSTSSPSLLSS